ncbi:MAG: flagellar hook basal-body protein [Ignavibacteria bacterium]|jgi:flagellar basal-body rod protein FlgG|nr:flagellar hook basal-body protein [Ignavibacteria bacterium]MDP3830789.1 flagellar hook basal-body protein [Ignavibacteriaceae bacterium]
MIKGIYNSARSLDARQKNMDIISNNLANLNTVGFKREVPFSQVISEMGESRFRQVTDFRQGDFITTSNPLDMAISGAGLFVVKTENGLQLTRNGRFQISDEGFLVNSAGQKVIGKNGEISFSNSMLSQNRSVSVSKEGEIKYGEDIMDALLIVRFTNQDNELLKSSSNFIFDESNIEEVPESEYQIAQGYLEESNVNPILEMEAMINLSKDYESTYKMIQQLDQSLEKANEIGKV